MSYPRTQLDASVESRTSDLLDLKCNAQATTARMHDSLFLYDMSSFIDDVKICAALCILRSCCVLAVFFYEHDMSDV